MYHKKIIGWCFLLVEVMSNLGVGLTDEFYRSNDNNAKLELVRRILGDMDTLCDARQLMNLSDMLEETLKRYSIAVSETSDIPIDVDKVNNFLISRFKQAKESQGLSSKSIRFYENTLDMLVLFYPEKALSQFQRLVPLSA